MQLSIQFYLSQKSEITKSPNHNKKYSGKNKSFHIRFRFFFNKNQIENINYKKQGHYKWHKNSHKSQI